jgi:predicted nucleic acid-binding protein
MLVDNSAWSRLRHPSLNALRANEIAGALESGGLVVSLPLLLETGYSARDGREHAQLMDDLQALPQVGIDGEVERRALAAQSQLERSGHHRIPPADLIVAALADRHELDVLHYDADFDQILDRTDLRFESVWLAERGSL